MRFHLIAAFAVLTLGVSQSFALTANFANDFSIAGSNPNGAWTYGYTTSLGGTLNVFTTKVAAPTADIWYTPGLSGDNTPSVFKNTSGGTVNGVGPLEAGLHSGPGGQLAVARYTSSENAQVNISGMFKAGDNGRVGAYVLVDGVQVFGAPDAPSDEAFAVVANLNVGSTVDFVISNGTDGYAFDSTPLTANIESVPEPATMGLLAVAGLAALRRRRAR